MKINEVVKNPSLKNRNPVAAYAQKTGAGVHSDQNKKNKPARKEKHKKKDYATQEAYTQKAGDYARHGGPMPKKKKRGPHPLGGKLVG